MPEKLGPLCEYLRGGEHCIFNKTDKEGVDIVPSGTRRKGPNLYWDGDFEVWLPMPSEIKYSLLPAPDEPSRPCEIARPLGSINAIGKAQKGCDVFIRSKNPHPWEQLIPLG